MNSKDEKTDHEHPRSPLAGRAGYNPAATASIVNQPAFGAAAQSIHCNIVPRLPEKCARARHTRIEAVKLPAVGCIIEPEARA